MEFGLFHEFQKSRETSEEEAFSQSFALVDAAEQWGLDAMWLAELHFVPDRSVLASPLILAAAMRFDDAPTDGQSHGLFLALLS